MRDDPIEHGEDAADPLDPDTAERLRHRPAPAIPLWVDDRIFAAARARLNETAFSKAARPDTHPRFDRLSPVAVWLAVAAALAVIAVGTVRQTSRMGERTQGEQSGAEATVVAPLPLGPAAVASLAWDAGDAAIDNRLEATRRRLAFVQLGGGAGAWGAASSFGARSLDRLAQETWELRIEEEARDLPKTREAAPAVDSQDSSNGNPRFSRIVKEA